MTTQEIASEARYILVAVSAVSWALGWTLGNLFARWIASWEIESLKSINKKLWQQSDGLISEVCTRQTPEQVVDYILPALQEKIRYKGYDPTGRAHLASGK